MDYTLLPSKITKKFILSHNITEENIMEHYLGIPVKKGLFKSPLRQDNTPTCAFYRNSKNDLIFKDFRGDFYGNFISVVMYMFNCDVNKALEIVANDFGIISNANLYQNPRKIKNYTNMIFSETQGSIIQIEYQDFSKFELDWWNAYGISLKTLKKFNVFSCKNVFLNNKLFHLNKTNQLVFGYYNGIKKNIEQWRIYFPGKKKYKFISNWKSIYIQGALQLPKTGGEYLVITKSLKDCMVLYELNISAIAPISENLFVTESQYERLSKKFKYLILFYDNDLAGINNMNKIRKKYSDIIVVYIPRNNKCKDISDFYKKYGKQKTIDLINDTKKYINEHYKKDSI